MDPPDFAVIIRYHEETKHHPGRYARSPGYMDWSNQPDPFRFYAGEAPVQLPFLEKDPQGGWPDLFRRENTRPQPFTMDRIAGFLELSLGLSAWKSGGGSKWSLRINPSSGNLHPTEAHLVLADDTGTGVYHYSPFLHALEPRTAASPTVRDLIRACLGTNGFMVALTSIFWRESWKYGERAYRYCNHDVGHALAALGFSAGLFGWRLVYLNGLSDKAVETVVGLSKTDYPENMREHADVLCFVCNASVTDVPRSLSREVLAAFDTLSFFGKPNRLSEASRRWPVIYDAVRATRKPETRPQCFEADPRDLFNARGIRKNAAAIIRSRRSAIDFDRNGSISKADFFDMLDKTLVRPGIVPFDADLGPPAIDLLIFVHAVNDIAPGMYYLFRNEDRLEDIRQHTCPDFLWQPVEKGRPFYVLKKQDYRRETKFVSCHQAIAGDGVFSLGMIARFRETLVGAPFRYRHLLWEAGMIGQVLYLAAEAHGVRGTGIGCYFDDEVHRLMGLDGNHYQSLYHFTVGRPLEDPRLQTLPPYHHLPGGFHGRQSPYQ